MQSPRPIIVKIAAESDELSWNSYLLKKKLTVPISLYQLKFVVKNIFFFQRPLFFVAKDKQGNVKGLCSCFLVKSFSGKKKLYSSRFGLNADNNLVANLIFNYIRDYCSENEIPEFVCTSGFQNFNISSEKYYKISMIMELKKDYEFFWNNLRAKTRNAIRKSEKFNFYISSNKIYLNQFYNVYKKNMLKKEVDVLPFKFFSKLIKFYGEHAQLYSVLDKSGTYLGSLILIKGKKIAQYTFASTIKNSKNAMHFLLSEVIKVLYRDGIDFFDMSESTREGGVYLFKKYFGASEKKVYYYSTVKSSTEKKVTSTKIDGNLIKQFFIKKIKNQLTRIV